MYHSIVDAILGALTMPDIGQLFPDNDPKLKVTRHVGNMLRPIFFSSYHSSFFLRITNSFSNFYHILQDADSSIFMEEAYRRMTERGYRISNCDVTLILQKPKVMDFKPAMKENCVRLLRTTNDRVNIKARTHEKVDSSGEGKSYQCHVVVLLEKI